MNTVQSDSKVNLLIAKQKYEKVITLKRFSHNFYHSPLLSPLLCHYWGGLKEFFEDVSVVGEASVRGVRVERDFVGDFVEAIA